ncbi:MAG: hypothetical protein WEB33_11550 [Bacteroidota bacterium]
MPRIHFLILLILCILMTLNTAAQQRNTALIRSVLEDQGISITLDRPYYFPGDTVRLAIQLEDSTATASVTPSIAITGVKLMPAGPDAYTAILPNNVLPGSYRILLNTKRTNGRKAVLETDRVIEIEESQVVERLDKYVGIAPSDGGGDLRTAETLDHGQIRGLQVVFLRDSIGPQLGPQFVTITTSVHLRDLTIIQSLERRVVTFRSHKDRELDRSVFIQYRTAYGPYAAISAEELERVLLPFDSLPAWSIIKVRVEPDYTIRIGAYDRSNSITRYFRVRGPAIEIGFSLGIPKVLYDTQAEDTVLYGNTSAMVRFYNVNLESGNRFPVSLGIGTFGVNSPIDVGVGRGGFAVSVFLDLVELMRSFGIEFVKSINAGMELSPFFSIGKRARLLVNAQVSLAL